VQNTCDAVTLVPACTDPTFEDRVGSQPRRAASRSDALDVMTSGRSGLPIATRQDAGLRQHKIELALGLL
jgi:hypothetical protein